MSLIGFLSLFTHTPLIQPPSQTHFLPCATLTPRKKWIASPSIQNDQICSVPSNLNQVIMLDRKALELKVSPVFVRVRWNRVALCGPMCIYEWLSLGAKLGNNAATLKDSFWDGRGVGGVVGDDGCDGGGGQSTLFPTVGAWYRGWREVLVVRCFACECGCWSCSYRSYWTFGGRLWSPTQVRSSFYLWFLSSFEVFIFSWEKKQQDTDFFTWGLNFI